MVLKLLQNECVVCMVLRENNLYVYMPKDASLYIMYHSSVLFTS